MEKALIFNIQRFAVHDGPGIRTTVFMKGCPLKCWWCHNPESQEMEVEYLDRQHVHNDKVVHDKEQIGRYYSSKELFAEIRKDMLFFDQSGGGVSFSGGEPLMQITALEGILKKCKEEDIHTVVDTCGFASWKSFERILNLVDLFLYDIKLFEEEAHQKYLLQDIGPIYDNLFKLSESGAEIIIRFPIIPDITDTPANIKAAIDFLHRLPSFKRLDILPYHKIAGEKYKRFGKENKMEAYKEPTKSYMNMLKERFQKEGFEVQIGG